jgi:hypothetical protein
MSELLIQTLLTGYAAGTVTMLWVTWAVDLRHRKR